MEALECARSVAPLKLPLQAKYVEWFADLQLPLHAMYAVLIAGYVECFWGQRVRLLAHVLRTGHQLMAEAHTFDLHFYCMSLIAGIKTSASPKIYAAGGSSIAAAAP